MARTARALSAKTNVLPFRCLPMSEKVVEIPQTAKGKVLEFRSKLLKITALDNSFATLGINKGDCVAVRICSDSVEINPDTIYFVFHKQRNGYFLTFIDSGYYLTLRPADTEFESIRVKRSEIAIKGVLYQQNA
jgi:hypothetical protein